MKAPLLTLVLLGSLALPLAAAAPAPGKWTVLVYLDADNNLEDSGMLNVHEMESVGPASGVRVLVQMDRAPGYDTTDGDWQGAHRFEITKDASGSTDALASPVLTDMGEVDMSDPAVLQDFLTWGVQTAPADHYYVILWDHGAAWDGLLADETTGPDALMPLSGMRTALSDAANATGVASWDVVDMDACLMGTADAAHALAGVAKVLVGSEELVPGQGLPYPQLLRTLDAHPDISPIEIAKTVVTAYGARYSGTDASIPRDDDAVLAAMDLTAEPAFHTALTAFADGVTRDAPTSWPEFVRDAKASDRYKKPDAQNSEAIDLADLASHVAASTTDAALKNAANAVQGAQTRLIVAHTTSPNHPHASGITIQFATPSAGGGSSEGAAEGERAATSRQFEAVGAAAKSDKTDPAIGAFALDTASDFSASAPLTFHASASDANLDTLEAAVSEDKANGETILLYLQPTSVDSSSDGTNLSARFSWNGVGTALSNGKTRALVPAYSAGPAGGYLLEGNYSVGGAASFEATLEFDANGTLVHAWDESGGASEIHPRTGDAFAPSFLHFDADGNDRTILGPAIPAAKDGLAAWSLTNATIPNGEYYVSIYAADLAGNANLSEPEAVTFGAATPATPTPTPTSTPATAPPVATPTSSSPVSDEKPSPGVGVLSVLAIAGVAAFAWRRRR